MGPTLEQFAEAHNLPLRWLELRRGCESIVRDPQFWSRQDLQTKARELAVQASELLSRARQAV